MQTKHNATPEPRADELTPADLAIVQCLRLLYRRGMQVRELTRQEQPTQPTTAQPNTTPSEAQQ